MTLERGALLHKRYRIVEILGQGGMGSVYRAVDENLGVDVAVKENLFTTDEYARQFRLEAVILANLRHPNLPRVTDHFVIGDQGQYLVMDYIEGEDLRQRMERQGNISEDEAILLGAAICDALTYLHTRKPPILHRDIKPGNVKITPDGHIFLVDFGLAKVLHGSQATTTGARAMTPGYSPPEQYGTARTDPRTDIYSLGATVYAALSGIIPEDGLARAMDNTQLTPLRKRNAKISRRFAAAIEKAMGIDPADRFQTAEEFKRALLGSKSKTQRLPGDYVIQGSPESEEPKQNPIERESKPLNDFRSANGRKSVSQEEPVFKPPKKKRKGRKLLTAILWLLLLLAFGTVALVRFLPSLVPPALMDILEPVRTFPLPFVAPSNNSPTPLPPLPTEDALLPTATIPATVEVVLPSATNTPTPALPTATKQPILVFTATPDNAPDTGPTPLGGGGQIAFASSRTGIPQIYLSNVDGTGLTPITNMPNGSCQPSWSPDGNQLVFISPCRERGEFYDNAYKDSSLYLINADGTGQRALTTVPGADFDPAWSPDGKHIAFASLRDGRKEIYLLTIETGAVIRLTNSTNDIENSQPSWSPFSDQIVYTVKRVGAFQVWAMSATGEGNVQIVHSGQDLMDFSPIWMPDGVTIMFNERTKGPSFPWLMSIRYEDRDIKDPTRLDLPKPIEDPEFSPDGLWIVFEGQDDLGNRDIYFMTITGGDRTRLTNEPRSDFDPTWRPVAK
jgi:eukaryotic-like serine/threonine-protein kinase